MGNFFHVSRGIDASGYVTIVGGRAATRRVITSNTCVRFNDTNTLKLADSTTSNERTTGVQNTQTGFKMHTAPYSE